VDTASDRAVWVVVGVLVGAVGAALWHRLGGPPLVADTDAAAQTGLTKPVTEKRREASQRAVRKLNSTRFRCAECDYTSTAGPLGVHHKKSGHRGRIKADA
jgi:hypothetical protein